MNINRIIVCALALLILLIFTSVPNAAALVIEKSLNDITIESDNIVTGKVLNKESYWKNGKIFTDVTVSVGENIKGKPENKIIVQVPGGVVGDIYARVSDVPLFENNEEVLLFLKGNKVTGWNQGKYTIKNDKIKENGKSVTEFIDNIKQNLKVSAENEKKEVQKDLTTSKAPHITNVTPDSGPAKALELGSTTAGANSTQVTITGLNFGSLEGKAKFWHAGAVSYNATILSWTDTMIVAKVPGGISSYFKPDGTGNVRIIKNDGTPGDNYGDFRVTYSYNGARWPGNSVTYKINPNTPDTAGELAAVKAAANMWNNAGANFGFKYGGLSNKTDVSKDGENSIIWVNYDTGSIATTTTYWNMADFNEIIENDLEFNDLTLDWGTDGPLTGMDVQTIATHELGHFLGFADMYGTADNAKIMNGYGTKGIIKRKLTKDDISGIKGIYGSKSIKVKYPNGQETWVRGNEYTIKWSYKGNPGPDVRIQLLKNGSVVGNVTARTPNDGSYNWTVSSRRIPGNDYKIRVMSTSNSAYKDTSNRNFIIE
jgi:Ser-Thr-rich glycosyl-phosphatidyl-inositol-anchored membrane family/Matrixin